MMSKLTNKEYLVLSRMFHKSRVAHGLPKIMVDALEISRYIMRESICSKLQIKRKLPLLVFSDAHVINDIGRATTDFFLKAATIDEISMAFAEKSGRRVGD